MQKIIDKKSESNDDALPEDIYDLNGFDEVVESIYQLSDFQLSAFEKIAAPNKRRQIF
ncbi:MAG: hypothetical protein H7211_09435 [Aquabacterium sp.]|nr:hypothetical protein [Ferruginibacter sp.]